MTDMESIDLLRKLTISIRRNSFDPLFAPQPKLLCIRHIQLLWTLRFRHHRSHLDLGRQMLERWRLAMDRKDNAARYSACAKHLLLGYPTLSTWFHHFDHYNVLHQTRLLRWRRCWAFAHLCKCSVGSRSVYNMVSQKGNCHILSLITAFRLEIWSTILSFQKECS